MQEDSIQSVEARHAALALYAKDRSIENRNKVVWLNRGLAYRLAFKYINRRVDLRELQEDFEQAAFVGLICAVEGFDPGAKVAFSTYATRAIHDNMQRCMRKKKGVGRYAQQRIDEVKSAIAVYYATNGVDPTVEELQKLCNMTPQTFRFILRFLPAADCCSLDSVLDDCGGDSESIIDRTPVDNSMHTELALDLICAGLSDLSARVMRDRYAFGMERKQIMKKEGLRVGSLQDILYEASKAVLARHKDVDKLVEAVCS